MYLKKVIMLPPFYSMVILISFKVVACLRLLGIGNVLLFLKGFLSNTTWDHLLYLSLVIFEMTHPYKMALL